MPCTATHARMPGPNPLVGCKIAAKWVSQFASKMHLCLERVPPACANQATHCKQHPLRDPMIRHQCIFHNRHFVSATTARHQHQQFHWTRVQLCTEASGLMGQCPDYPVCNQASHETRPCMPIWFASGSHGTMPRMPASTPLLGDALLRNTYNIHSSKRRESASVTTSGSHGLDERLRRYAQGCHVPQVPRAAPDHLQHVLPLALRAIGTRCSARGCFSCRCRRSPGAT
jgi:hypothetical protein